MTAADDSLAAYATISDGRRGRLHPESEASRRSPFQRDRDRIIHSTAFRRLQYKTQVFVYHEGDHYRTRLTHSLEVAQITRSICRALGLNEDLAEALALAHDLGHTPFGHAGEDILDALMQDHGGFDHNAQTLRILTKLETRYADFEGLNLTWETLEGLAKHNGPLLDHLGQGDLPAAIVEYAVEQDLELHTFSGPEAQVAALSDDIAYNNHDIDDGLRAGLFQIGDLLEVPLVGPMFREVTSLYPGLEPARVTHEAIRRLINLMVEDLIGETSRRAATFQVHSVRDVRALGGPLAAFSDEVRTADKVLKDFLYENMYRHGRVNRMSEKARQVVSDLFGLYMAEPGRLPPEWREPDEAPGGAKMARRIADFIAGMTDRFALEEHRKLFNSGIEC